MKVNGVYQISNVNQLQLMNADLNGSYILTNDIDASNTNYGLGNLGTFGASGFQPVGTSENPFTGTLSGAGYSITTLFISRPDRDDVGLIGRLGATGSISDITIGNDRSGASVTGRTRVGALVGTNDGTITRVGSTAGVHGVSDIGELVGVNNGTISLSVSLYGVNANEIAGGLVGTNTGVVRESFSRGSVYAASGAGGLIGRNRGSVLDSYSLGSVSGGTDVGGLIGINTGTVSRVYAAGDVSGSDHVGGLIGDNSGAGMQAVQFGYWNKNPSQTITGAGLGDDSDISGLSDDALHSQTNYRENYAGFDFNNVWLLPVMNYNINSASLMNMQRFVVVSPEAATVSYGDPLSNIAITYRGLQPNDFITKLAKVSTFRGDFPSVGSANARVWDAASSVRNDKPYGFLFQSGVIQVTPRSVIVSADPITRTYGDSNPTLTYTVGGAGLVYGHKLSGALATSATTSSNVGRYAIEQGTLSLGTNYTLTFKSNALTVTPRPITVTADPAARLYGAVNPVMTYVVGGAGLVNGDTLTGGLTSDATLYSNAGQYAIRQGDLSAGDNYQLSYVGNVLTVNPRTITVTANSQTRAYGDANPALTYSVGGDGLGYGVSLSGGLETVATDTSHVGSYPITQGSLTAGANYAMTFVGADLTVVPRALTVEADSWGRLYGDTNPDLSYTFKVGRLAPGDRLSGALETSATTTSNIGTYPITQGTLAASSDYALTFVGGTMYVHPRLLEITANAVTRSYGDPDPVLTYTVGGNGLAAGDTFTGALATTATAKSIAGKYQIMAGSLTAGSNYIANFYDNYLTITPRPLIITAQPASRVYGENNPVLSYGIGGAGLATDDYLVGTPETSATPASNVGSYGITIGSLRVTSLGYEYAGIGDSYAVSFIGNALTVTPRPLTVTANDATRMVGRPNSSLSYTVQEGGLLFGDRLTGRLSTLATAQSPIGRYPIEQGSLASSPNYSLTYTPGTLTVVAGNLTPLTQVPTSFVSASQLTNRSSVPGGSSSASSPGNGFANPATDPACDGSQPCQP